MLNLSSQLINSGYESTHHVENADIMILNTCSVTAHTESKTKRLIKKISRKNNRINQIRGRWEYYKHVNYINI